MSKDKKNPEEKANFEGAVSLDSIFASISKNKDQSTSQPPLIKEEPKQEKVETPKVDEPEVIKEVVQETPPAVPPVEEKPVEQPSTETEAFKTAKRLISLGILEDFAIQDPENSESSILVSEFTQMSDDNLEELVKISKEEKKKEVSSKFISKDGLKEHHLKVIEILQNGGDLSKIAENPQDAFDRPFEGFDMEDQKRQIDVRYIDLVHSKGLDHDSAITLIDKEIKAGTLEKKAKSTFDLYRQEHSDYIDSQLKEQQRAKQFKDQNFKENKKALTAKLKEAGFKEKVYKKVSSEYGKKNESGDYALVDKLRQILDNPEDHYEVILHLTDKELFNEVYKIKASHETQKAIITLATTSQTKSGRQATKTETTSESVAPWLKGAEAYNQFVTKKQ